MDKRNIGQEILESIRAIKRGEGKRYTMALPDSKAICERQCGRNSSEARAKCDMPNVRRRATDA